MSKVYEQVQALCEVLNGRPDTPQWSFCIEEGRRYYKVVRESCHPKFSRNLSARSVHCFVDKETGAVYKSASWRAPAKGVRYNLMDEASRELCFQYADVYGGYLYHL